MKGSKFFVYTFGHVHIKEKKKIEGNVMCNRETSCVTVRKEGMNFYLEPPIYVTKCGY